MGKITPRACQQLLMQPVVKVVGCLSTERKNLLASNNIGEVGCIAPA